MLDNSTDDLILEKLIVLYTLNSMDEDLTDSQLTEIILGTGVINYFVLLALLPKMMDAKFITTYEKNNTKLNALTQSGLEVLVYFQNRIPEFFVKKIDDYIRDSKEELLSTQIKKQTHYSLQGDSSYLVNLVIIKGRQNVMNVNVNVDTEEEAKAMCDKWNKDYENKYNQIIDIINS